MNIAVTTKVSISNRCVIVRNTITPSAFSPFTSRGTSLSAPGTAYTIICASFSHCSAVSSNVYVFPLHPVSSSNFSVKNLPALIFSNDTLPDATFLSSSSFRR